MQHVVAGRSLVVLALFGSGCWDFSQFEVSLDASTSTDLASTDFAERDLASADLTMSEFTIPDLTILDFTIPDLAIPDLTMIDQSIADLAAADLATPDLAMPDLATPDLTFPDLATPDLVTLPDLTPIDLSQPAPCDTLGNCIVFATSDLHAPNFGSLAAADSICQGLAVVAHLPGAYKAWLSDDNTSAASRLSHSVNPYVLVDNTVVAANWAQLVNGPLTNPIHLTEKGADSPVGADNRRAALTATNSDGSAAVGLTCTNWTGMQQIKGGAAVGDTTVTTGLWSLKWIDPNCTVAHSLYCIEQ